jgi:hypothetical protein
VITQNSGMVREELLDVFVVSINVSEVGFATCLVSKVDVAGTFLH